MTALGFSPFFVKYMAMWALFCVAAVFILIWDRKRLLPEWREYLRFLCVPWKLCLFVPALIFVSFAGRYTNDETWDLVTGSGMALLTFLTAPWSVGLIYVRRRFASSSGGGDSAGSDGDIEVLEWQL
jgi:hypothetical protein